MSRSSNFEDLSEYFSGAKLYGDDFSIDKIKEWYDYQKEWYEDNENELNYSDHAKAIYSYHASNNFHGYKFIKGRKFEKLLGFGSAYGDELQPVLNQVENITILEISSNFISTEIYEKPVKYIVPNIDGTLSFPDNTFNLIICYGVLHHIPNVSKVIQEISRCLKEEGIAFIREPIISMGDWSKPRKGLTDNERGIPIKIFRKIIKDANLKVLKERFCMIKLTNILFKWYKKPIFNSKIIVIIDFVLSFLFIWNINYHPKNKIRTLRPSCVFYILSKQN